MEDVIWDTVGRDRFLLEISRGKQQRCSEANFPDCGQKHFGVSRFHPGQNIFNLQFTESSAGSGSSLWGGRRCHGREEENPRCYSAVLTAPDRMAFRNEALDVAQRTQAVICLSVPWKFIGIVTSCLTQGGKYGFHPRWSRGALWEPEGFPSEPRPPISSPPPPGNLCTSL